MLIFVCAFSSFSGTFADEMKDRKAQEKNVNEIFCIPQVEYRNQNEKGRSQWCVIYSTCMLLTRYRIYEKPETIAKAMNMEEREEAYFSWKSIFSQDGSVERYLQDNHKLETKKKIFVTLRKPYEVWIKRNLKQGSPVLLLYGRLNGHAILLVGYDEKHLYINDPSGAFFSDATKVLGRPTYPRIWCRENRNSRFEGAGVLWTDFRTFLKKHNYWGYMLAVTGRKAEEGMPDGKKAEEKKMESRKPENGVGEKKKRLWDQRKMEILLF